MPIDKREIDNIQWRQGYNGNPERATPAYLCDIASYVQAHVASDNFDTVFNAIVQALYFYQQPYSVSFALPDNIDEATKAVIRSFLEQMKGK